MASLGTTFDATSVAPATEFQPLPQGEYEAMIIDSDMQQTKSGSGSFLKLTMQVLDGTHKGSVFFDRLNLVNTNPTAVEIAQRALSAICHAIGVMQVTDSTQLHNKPMLVRVALKPASGEYGPSNEVKGYKAIGSATAPAVPQAAPQAPAARTPSAPAQPQAQTGTPPWMNRAA